MCTSLVKNINIKYKCIHINIHGYIIFGIDPNGNKTWLNSIIMYVFYV